MDLLGTSLDDLIKKDRKTGRGGKGGIHNKMRQKNERIAKADRPAGIRGGKRGTGIRGTGIRGSGTPRPGRGGAQSVAKVNRNKNRIQKDRPEKGATKPARGGKTLVVNPNSRRNGGLKKAAAAAGVSNKKATPQAAGGQVAAKRQEILQLKRQLRRALQRKKALGGVAQQQQKPTPQNSKQSTRPQQNGNNARRQPQAPVKAASTQAIQQKRGQFQANREPRGPIEKRKLKVHNIDKATVTVQDLKTLFGKCGPLFNCNFDFDEFGQYLGTVTIVYMNEAHAAKAITNYNRAAIDNKVMRVVYASEQEKNPRSASKGQGERPQPRFKQQGPKKHAQKTIRKR